MGTAGKKIRFEGRKPLKSLARPEGFEPPTLRSEVRFAYLVPCSQVISSHFPSSVHFSFIRLRLVLAESGSKAFSQTCFLKRRLNEDRNQHDKTAS